jgi:tetratricopeptide (TPR) repeat protein
MNGRASGFGQRPGASPSRLGWSDCILPTKLIRSIQSESKPEATLTVPAEWLSPVAYKWLWLSATLMRDTKDNGKQRGGTMQGRKIAAGSLILLTASCLLLPRQTSYMAEANEQAGPSVHTTLQRQLPPESRGDVLMAQRQYVAAIKAYREAPGNSAVVWNKIGIAWQHLFAIDEAKLAYNRALRIKPRYPEAINNLGTIYYAKKNYKKAEKLYRRALKLMPHSATVYNNLGAAYFAQGKFRQGAEAYRSAFAIDPAVFSADSFQGIPELGSSAQQARQNYCLAELFARAGMTDRAIEYLRKAFDEGFSDRKRLMKDRDFTSLRNTAAFAQLTGQKKRP